MEPDHPRPPGPTHQRQASPRAERSLHTLRHGGRPREAFAIDPDGSNEVRSGRVTSVARPARRTASTSCVQPGSTGSGQGLPQPASMGRRSRSSMPTPTGTSACCVQTGFRMGRGSCAPVTGTGPPTNRISVYTRSAPPTAETWLASRPRPRAASTATRSSPVMAGTSCSTGSAGPTSTGRCIASTPMAHISSSSALTLFLSPTRSGVWRPTGHPMESRLHSERLSRQLIPRRSTWSVPTARVSARSCRRRQARYPPAGRPTVSGSHLPADTARSHKSGSSIQMERGSSSSPRVGTDRFRRPELVSRRHEVGVYAVQGRDRDR